MISNWQSVRQRTLRLTALSVVLGVAPANAQESAPTVPLPEVVVQGQTQPKPTQKKSVSKAKLTAKSQAAATSAVKEPIAVSDGASTPAGATNGYVATEGIAATKTSTPLVEVPQSISTVTRQQLQDRAPQNLGDAIQYVPGVRVNVSGYDPRFDTFNIRGFDATYTGVYRDGLRQMSSGFGQFRTEPYGLDSVTILRGPVSSLYGASNAGGIVDMYSKRPTETPFHEIEFQVGSYDRFQGNFDFSGPTAPGSNVLYRMTGVVRDSNTEAMGVPDDRLYLAPALTFKIDPDTKLTILGEYMDAKTGGNMAWYNDYSSGHAQRTNIWSGDPAFNAFDQTQERIGYEFEHRFSDAITFRQKARYSHLSSVGEYIDIIELIEPNVWSRANGVVESNVNNFVIDNQAEARFSTGPLKHVALGGVDLAYVWYKEGNGFGDPIEDGGIVPPLINYNYGQQHIPTPAISTVTHQDQLMVGTYLQDQIKLDRWVLTVGGRRDWVNTATDTDGDVLKQNDAAWTGRAGLSYLFDSGFAPYIAYGTGFVANSGTDLITGKPFNATTSESKEVGFKYFIPGYNASIASAVFDIQQTNGLRDQCVDVNDVTDVTECGSVQTGVLRSRGFEIEGTTTLNNGLSLLASYSYIDMRIEDNTGGNQGNVLSSVPFNTFSLWGDYTLRSGPAVGLGFGLGVRYIGSSFGDDENTFKNSGHTLFDAALHYDLAKFDPRFAGARLQINANNVFDTRDDVCSSNYCYLDQGRTVLGSLRYRW
ncbi:MAG: TonB-dependent siderophore receptor [Proteobacteria bacterium]|nr:TonB-dependent siderophore receptor [Pseudomonadota bacterium]